MSFFRFFTGSNLSVWNNLGFSANIANKKKGDLCKKKCKLRVSNFIILLISFKRHDRLKGFWFWTVKTTCHGFIRCSLSLSLCSIFRVPNIKRISAGELSSTSETVHQLDSSPWIHMEPGNSSAFSLWLYLCAVHEHPKIVDGACDYYGCRSQGKCSIGIGQKRADSYSPNMRICIICFHGLSPDTTLDMAVVL